MDSDGSPVPRDCPAHGEDGVVKCVISRPDQRRGSKEQGQTGVYLVWR
jgi:hypothetical protein